MDKRLHTRKLPGLTQQWCVGLCDWRDRFVVGNAHKPVLLAPHCYVDSHSVHRPSSLQRARHRHPLYTKATGQVLSIEQKTCSYDSVYCVKVMLQLQMNLTRATRGAQAPRAFDSFVHWKRDDRMLLCLYHKPVTTKGSSHTVSSIQVFIEVTTACYSYTFKATVQNQLNHVEY